MGNLQQWISSVVHNRVTSLAYLFTRVFSWWSIPSWANLAHPLLSWRHLWSYTREGGAKRSSQPLPYTSIASGLSACHNYDSSSIREPCHNCNSIREWKILECSNRARIDSQLWQGSRIESSANRNCDRRFTWSLCNLLFCYLYSSSYYPTLNLSKER
jgi:hypothetical protein